MQSRRYCRIGPLVVAAKAPVLTEVGIVGTEVEGKFENGEFVRYFESLADAIDEIELILRPAPRMGF